MNYQIEIDARDNAIVELTLCNRQLLAENNEFSEVVRKLAAEVVALRNQVRPVNENA